MLSNSFQAVNSGAFKSNSCWLKVLYLCGGYYFNDDLEVVLSILLGDDISFRSTASTFPPIFFLSYLATTLWLDLLHCNLYAMVEYFQGQGKFMGVNWKLVTLLFMIPNSIKRISILESKKVIDAHDKCPWMNLCDCNLAALRTI